MTKKKATPIDPAAQLERRNQLLADNIDAARVEIARRAEAYGLATSNLLMFESSPTRGGRFLLAAWQHARRAGKPVQPHEVNLVERIASHMDRVVDKVLQWAPERNREAHNRATLAAALSLGSKREETAARRRQAANLARLGDLEKRLLCQQLGKEVAKPSRAELERIASVAAGVGLTTARAAWDSLDGADQVEAAMLGRIKGAVSSAPTREVAPADPAAKRRSAAKPSVWRTQALSKRTK